MTNRFAGLLDFNDGRFCSVTRSQWQSVLLGYEISMAVSFGGLCDLIDGKFSISVIFLLRDFKYGQFWWVM